jgi:hypothetical protein
MAGMADAIGCPRAGMVRGALELAARHIAEQAPGTPAAAAAQDFLRQSYDLERRALWAAALGLEVAALGQPLVEAA